ncbi:MAG TPA: hypothetical protein VMV27_10090, partial [Candidatus Binataceae bacterium]|nr:hypothetical protein [Candidatus Binataceae bacterium]
MSGKLSNGLDRHQRIFGESGHKCVPCIVKAAIDFGSTAGSFKCGFVAPLAHRTFQVQVPDQRFAAIARETHAMERKYITIRWSIGKSCEPIRERYARAVREGNDTSRAAGRFGLRYYNFAFD